MTAGELDKRVSVLELVQDGVNWDWAVAHETYARIELKLGRSIFSSAAMSARSAELILRRQKITLRNTIQRGEDYYFITAVDDGPAPNFIKVSAAVLAPVAVTRRLVSFGTNALNNPVRLPDKESGFPAWLTEKYSRLNDSGSSGVVEVGYVLIVPKAVPELPVGDIVTVGGKEYAVTAQHLLDPDKNEYEIELRGDV